jgi:DNA-binding LacI/PurR family transcriptional regulator
MKTAGQTGRKRAGATHRSASLRDIAEVTGFSVTTVSMVLNGRAEEFSISPETRDLVLAAARKHDYQPNLHARSLRNRTTDILGLTVPSLANPFFSTIAETFERLARANRKLALITVTHHEQQQEIDTIRYFLSQKAACIFTANPMALEAVSELCTRAGTRQILVDSQPSGKQTVSTDNFEAARELTRMLLSSMATAGRPGRIYLVGGRREHAITQLRLAGFKAALQEGGVRFSVEQYLPMPFEAETAHQEIRRLFRTKSDIGGIFLNSLPALEGLVRFFSEAEERCRQIHFGVFDYHPLMSLLVNLQVVFIKQNPDQMMQRAYQIFSRGEEGERGRIHFVPYEVILTPPMQEHLPAVETGSHAVRAKLPGRAAPGALR